MKQAYHHKDLHNALIDEAILMLSEDGVGALTLRELARRLGVSHTAPYAHFAEKSALLRDVADVGFARLADGLEAAKASSHDPADAFRAMTLAYTRFARTNANLYRLMFADEQLTDDPECEMTSEGERAFAVLEETIAALRASGEHLRETAVAAWAFVHGVSMLEIDRRVNLKTMQSGDEVAALGCEIIIRGLRP